jgi:hypothetical protein
MMRDPVPWCSARLRFGATSRVQWKFSAVGDGVTFRITGCRGLRKIPRATHSGFDSHCVAPYRALMPAPLDAISHDALVLPPDQRVTLAYRLLASVETDPEPGADSAWEAEIADLRARASPIDTGGRGLSLRVE